jgi:hypothetical protein
MVAPAQILGILDGGDVGSAHQDLALYHGARHAIDHAVEREKQARFAGVGRSDDREDLVLRHVERHAFQGDGRAEADREIRDLDLGGGLFRAYARSGALCVHHARFPRIMRCMIVYAVVLMIRIVQMSTAAVA